MIVPLVPCSEHACEISPTGVLWSPLKVPPKVNELPHVEHAGRRAIHASYFQEGATVATVRYSVTVTRQNTDADFTKKLKTRTVPWAGVLRKTAY